MNIKDANKIEIKREIIIKEEKKENKIKKYFKKFWHLLWKDDSLKGWIFSLVFMFVFIKFVFFPLLGLITGTSLPLAIVESCSMYHKGDFFSNYDKWWLNHDEKYSQLDINKKTFEDFRFKKGFNKGDILFVIGTKPEKLRVGDIIIFEAEQRNPVIHRIIKIEKQNEEYIFSTLGDNNNGQLSSEKSINSERIMGKAVFKVVPYLGWAKLIFFEHTRIPEERGFCKEN